MYPPGWIPWATQLAATVSAAPLVVKFSPEVSVNPTGVGVLDGGSTVSLLGFGLLGLAALRRKLGC